jgi:RNA polymerase sigma-70 factor (ECF subfamily)
MNLSSSDVDLMRRVSRRDQYALSELYTRYGGPVYSLALRVLQNSTLAEEVTQDIFLKVWNQAEKWDPAKGQLASWLLTIARYTSIDRLRKERRQPTQTLTALDDMPHVLATRGLVDDPRWQDGRLIRSLLAQLPPEQVQVIELAFYQGFTHSEIAENLKLPLGTVKTRVRLGLQKLRNLWLEATPDQSRTSS